MLQDISLSTLKEYLSNKTLIPIILSLLLILLYNILVFIYNLIRSLYFKRNSIPLIPLDYNTISYLWSLNTRSLFNSLMNSFAKNSGGIYFWLTPVGKPFVVVSDANVLSQIIVENAGKLTKHHAFGILELFRQTDLKVGPAWKSVHRIASKFPINDIDLQNGLRDMLSSFIDSIDCIDSNTCFADFTRNYYWELVLFLVCGPTENKKERKNLQNLYANSWKACIDALSQPLAHMFSIYINLPFPKVIRYRYLAWKLRNEILNNIKKGDHKKFTVLSVISDEMCIEDQLEVAMEFMFTGASSVTSSLIFFIFELAKDSKLQTLLRQELIGVKNNNGNNDTWLNSNEVSDCKILEASLREVLRMYPPIHIGRLSLEEFCISDSNNNKIKISKGTDIFSNPWFFQRNEQHFPNPDNFDYTRFIDKPHNIPNYHPFSMGIRSCPGQRIAYNVLKLVVANIVTKYEIKLSSKSSLDAMFQQNLMLPVTPTKIFLEFNKLVK